MRQPLKTHYAIVGAGPAGISAAEAIREIDPDRDILLINGEPVPPYCRPLIVELLKGERTFDQIHLRDPEWYERHSVSLVTRERVVRLDTMEKKLELDSGGVVHWEKLLIAAGSEPSMPPIDGMERVPAFTLYRHADVERLKPLCKRGARALLVGIGLIGLQAMTALTEMGVEVVAVELMDKVLPVILDTRAAMYAQRRLEQNAIDVHVGTALNKLRPADRAERPYTALTDKEEQITFDFLIVAAGMRPNFSLIDGSGIETDRGIKVSPRMETSVPDVLAAGDVTEYSDWIEARSEIHAHWVNAYRQGRVAGLTMAGGDPQPYEPVYINSLSVFGLPIITMGASRIDDFEDAMVYISESPKRDSYTRLVVRDGRLIAATFVNDVDRAGVFQFLMREKVEIGDVADALFNQRLEGMQLLDKLHEKVVKGDVDWPGSMDLIERYRKDHSHTRWGKEESGKKKGA